MRSNLMHLRLIILVFVFILGRTISSAQLIECSHQEGFFNDYRSIAERMQREFPLQQEMIWNSYGNESAGVDPNRTGKWISKPFIADDQISMLATGFPKDCCRFTLLPADRSRYFDLHFRSNSPDRKWKFYQWSVPKPLRGKEVILELEDHPTIEPTGWFGFSFISENPQAIVREYDRDYEFRSLTSIPTLVFHFLLFILPGIAALQLLSHSTKFDRQLLEFPTLLFGSLLFPYIGFFVYLTSPEAGKFYSLFIFTLSSVVMLKFHQSWRKWISPETQTTLLLIFFLGMLIWSSGMIEVNPESSYGISKMRFHGSITPDNRLPRILGERLYFGEAISPFFLDWRSSDRPPLQAAVYLLQMPFMVNKADQYHFVGIICQALVIGSIFYFVSRIWRDRLLISILCSVAFFSGITIQNGFYVWPKLMAAAMGFMVAGLCFTSSESYQTENQRASIWLRWMLTGAFAAAGLLCHGGILFGFFSLGVLFLTKKKYHPSFQFWLAVIGALILCYLPWMVYQKLVDPPATRLIKWHFAGVIDVDSRTAWQALIDQYGSLSFSQWIQGRIENLVTLFRELPSFFSTLGGTSCIDDFECFQQDQHLGFFHSFSLLNILWLTPLFHVFHRSKPLYFERNLLFIFGFGVLLWCGLMFIPGSTIPHQGTYLLQYVGMFYLMTTAYRTSPQLAVGMAWINFLFYWIIWNQPFFFTKHLGDAIYNDINWSPTMLTTNIFTILGMGCILIFVIPKTPELNKLSQN